MTLYNSNSNMYSFPTDGYVYFSHEGMKLTACSVYIYSSNGNFIAQLKSAGDSVNNAYSDDVKSIFVKKGMKAFYHNTGGSDIAIRFYPVV